ncbi:MAG: DUF6365 family protein [bacterium]
MKIVFIVPTEGSTGELRTVLPIIGEGIKHNHKIYCFIYKKMSSLVPFSLRGYFNYWEDGVGQLSECLRLSEIVIFADYSNFQLPFVRRAISVETILDLIRRYKLKMATLDYFGLCLDSYANHPQISKPFNYGNPFLQKIISKKTAALFTIVPNGMKILRPCPFNRIEQDLNSIYCFNRYASMEYFKSDVTTQEEFAFLASPKHIFVQMVSTWVKKSLSLIYGGKAEEIGKYITGIVYRYIREIYGDDFVLVNISPFKLEKEGIINRSAVSYGEFINLVMKAKLVILYNMFSGVLMDCLNLGIPAISLFSAFPISKNHVSAMKGKVGVSEYDAIIGLLGEQIFPPFRALGLYYENALLHLLDDNPYFQKISLLDIFDEQVVQKFLTNPVFTIPDFSPYRELPSFWQIAPNVFSD